MDMKKEREAFEASQNQKIFKWFEFDSSVNAYVLKDISATLEKLTDLAELNYGWDMWQAAKAQAVPEKDAVIKKLSDQLYAQEMKASAARVLCETACELLDDYAHQDAMVILNDLEQAMKEPTND